MIEARRFKNGNIHVKGTPDPDTRESTLIQVLWALDEVDTYLIGEEWSAGNWDCGITVYSYYEDKCYDILEGYDVNKIEEGKTLILKGREATDIDREDIARYDGTYEDTDTDISTEATNDTNIA